MQHSPCRFLLLLGWLLLAWPGRGLAEDANAYGAKGRTIIEGSVAGSRTVFREPEGLGATSSKDARLHLTLVHFFVDNFALGGTILGGAQQLPDGPWAGRSETWFGADLDSVLHVPMSRRLSLRFWLWGGVRGGERSVPVSSESIGAPPQEESSTRLSLMFGLAPDLLLHLSPSTAISFGPSVSVDVPLRGDRSVKVRPNFGPSVTYSFGPDAEGEHARTQNPRRFAARGRNAFMGGFYLSDGAASLGYVRFVRNGFGIGAYTSVVSSLEDGLRRTSVGAGLQALGDIPLADVFSLMLMPQVGYRWTRFKFDSESPSPVSFAFSESAHAFVCTLPVLIALHLYDGLVVAVGPEGAASVDLVNGRDSLTLGFGSQLLGSF